MTMKTLFEHFCDNHTSIVLIIYFSAGNVFATVTSLQSGIIGSWIFSSEQQSVTFGM